KPTPTQPSKAVPESKQKLVKKTPDEPSPAKRSKGRLVGKIRKPKSPRKLVDEPIAIDVSGPARLVVIKEPDSRRIQPLLDIQGKGKEKVVEATHDLLTLLTLKNKSLVDQFIFQRRTPMPTEAFDHAESPSLDAEIALTDSETESDNVVPKINTGDQDEARLGQTLVIMMKARLDQTLVCKIKARLDQTLVMLQNLNLNQVKWFMLDQTLNT
nr:hypothetical protein [Tanacetum cinerariifolium]